MQSSVIINNIVNKISKDVSGGNTFFDKIDMELKKNENFFLIDDMFNKIYEKYGLNYNLVVSGGFGDLIIWYYKHGLIKCLGTILQLSGSLTSHFTDMDKVKKNKEVRIESLIGNIENKKFIFVDDSYYSGTTSVIINNFLKKYNSIILKTFIIYDGNDRKSNDRISLYNYYDWNKGSLRTIDELMNELDKYDDIPVDIFQHRIITGDITSIIQLRKEINNFKIKNNQNKIDIYSRIRESKILNFKNFKQI